MDAAEIGGREPIVAGSDAAAVLEPAEHALDGVAALVEGPAEATFPSPVGLRRDVRNGSLALDQATDPIAVVGAVRMDDAAGRQGREQRLGRSAVGSLTRRQMEGERTALVVREGMDLGVPAAPADADCLV